MIKSMSEILEIVETAPTETDKIRLLQENRTQALVDVLMGAFDSRIKWLLPEGPVPYKPTKLVGMEDRLHQEVRRFYLFVENGGVNIPQTKREALFIEMLENMNPKDAKLMESVKDKKLPYQSITSSLVVRAFPDVYIQPIIQEMKLDIPPSVSEPKKPTRKRPTSKKRSTKNRRTKK